jgi:hypothetical protein
LRQAAVKIHEFLLRGLSVRLSGLLLCCCVWTAHAAPDVHILPAEPASVQPPVQHPGLQLEWNNSRPEQRQALDNFYRSIQNMQVQEQAIQRMERQQRIEQLRGMSPEQRQQQFLNFVQQQQLAPGR